MSLSKKSLQNHYITRKKSSKKYHTYGDIINQAHKDNLIDDNQRNELLNFAQQMALLHKSSEQYVLYWWKEFAAIDDKEVKDQKAVEKNVSQKKHLVEVGVKNRNICL